MPHRARRLIFFLIATLVGIAGGLVYGWLINPVQYSDTNLQTLRVDYKTDFVLMVAEIYETEGDLAMALARISYLGDIPPQQLVQDAMDYAEKNHYSTSDLQLMQTMASAIDGAISTRK